VARAVLPPVMGEKKAEQMAGMAVMALGRKNLAA
jgi:hypothetical protein